MRRKLIYFVRHGESINNANGIRQGADGGLTEKGKLQAQETGERLKDYNFKLIISSPYERTRETTDIINATLAKPRPVKYSELFQERRNPSEIIGKSVKDPVVIDVVDHIDKSYHSDDYRYSDEENFLDLKNRARKALDYLSTQPGKAVLVVTHGIFLRMIAAYLLYGEKLTASDYNLMSFLNSSNNAGITVCEYMKPWFGKKLEHPWALVAWDDYVREPEVKPY